MGAVTAGSPTAMTRILDGPRAAAAAAALPDLPGPPAGGASRLVVALEDLAGDDGRPLGLAVLDVPEGGRAGVLVALTGNGPAATERLLRVGADHLRALGRRRLTASFPTTEAATLGALAAGGFQVVREREGRTDLVLELQE
jgi:hypothetical protein